ncbi:ParB N-terminal domain-containing protein [Limimaricola cinnabarinus]|uniref:ParB N-terminal domain-containing protein n=1 Tax=Limimaricola cinnabarinus TaxID=1125964 RepID=UPI00249299A5|nr:ParB N-terminal domain-containing protein [Limimaricola cinnabarinus]
MRKRKLNARPLPSDEVEERRATAPTANAVPLGGQWGGAIKGQMAVTRRELDAARERLTAVREGVLRGVIALEIETDAIVDEVGTDRIGDWTGDADFDALVRNIRERGQTQPIRVRPEDSTWRPAEADPLAVDKAARFVLQSGRRRLAACRKLGLPVRALIATDISQSLGQGAAQLKAAGGSVEALADLEERFAENTMRQALSPIEQLLSVGEIAALLPEMSQRAIASRLNVPQATVSIGLTCFRNRDELLRRAPADATHRDLRILAPTLGQGGQITDDATDVARPKPAQPRTTGRKLHLPRGGTIAVKETARGMTLAVRNIRVPERNRAEFERDLLTLLGRYEQE